MLGIFEMFLGLFVSVHPLRDKADRVTLFVLRQTFTALSGGTVLLLSSLPLGMFFLGLVSVVILRVWIISPATTRAI
jgi:hypothetical protein